jgi:hypothetical protein
VFVVGLLLALMARGAALRPLFYSIDSYGLAGRLTTSPTAQLRQGRFGQALIDELLTALGARPPLAGTMFVSLLLVVMAWVGVLVAREWRLDGDLPAALIAATLASLHPYQSELVSFSATPVYTSAALLLGFGALAFSTGIGFRLVGTSLLFALAMGCYQVVLNCAGVTLVFAVVFRLASRPGSWRAVTDYLLPKLVTLIGGCFAYLVISKGAWTLAGLQPFERARVVEFSDIPARLVAIRELLVRLSTAADPLLPVLSRGMLAAAGVLGILLLFREVLRRGRWPERARASVALAVLLLVGLASALGVAMASKEWWPVPRVLSAMSFLHAGTVSAAMLLAGRRMRILVGTVSALVVVSFLGVSNRIFADQQRVNLRDLAKASRIVAALEQRGDFARARRVALVGEQYAFASPIATMQGDMNISAFGAPWSKRHLLNEASGYALGAATADEEMLASKHCAGAWRWPDPRSIAVIEELAIVCL